MTLKIVQAGDPVLRKQARPLTTEEIRSPATQRLIELMRETMRVAPGVGRRLIGALSPSPRVMGVRVGRQPNGRTISQFSSASI